MTGWQPIKTIPTDGTEVLAAIKVHSATGSEWWERHVIAIDDETGEVLDSLYGGWDRNDYSHWHSLPDAPDAPTPASSDQAAAGMTANQLIAVIRTWLDADDATHWGDFEKALDRLISDGPSERSLIVVMLRADSSTIRQNANLYAEESPSDARALHEVASTLLFKAHQIERGDHETFSPTPASAAERVAL